ncbi:MAG: DNA polymerase III subunit gamma/tau, partial [Winogradskyella sp.]|nr:DNA polymerase III subunit gamma/tau [Winogradskyella sp.]
PVKVEKPVIKEKEKTAALAEPMQQTNQVGEITSAVETVVKPPEIKINKSSKSVSGLSLKSIKQKKEHQLKQLEVVINEEELPKDDVTQEQFIEAWKAYIERLHLKGEKILASILEMETPVLEGINIKITYPNETLKLELEREQYNLMGFLRKELNNFDLKLDIGVSEEVSKKYAFTPREKYDKLKEKNPNLELLKKTFGLDL